jgi:hypothetical protein
MNTTLPGAPAFHYQDGQLMVEQLRLSDLAREHGTPLFVYSKASMLAALAAWIQFEFTPGEPVAIGTAGFPGAWLSLDQLSSPLGSLAALLYFVTTLVTLRTKIRGLS